jgi:hypothetical protein
MKIIEGSDDELTTVSILYRFLYAVEDEGKTDTSSSPLVTGHRIDIDVIGGFPCNTLVDLQELGKTPMRGVNTFYWWKKAPLSPTSEKLT